MIELDIDTETYSETPISWGTYRYIGDCELMLLTYAVNDEPVACWDLTAGETMPRDLREAIIGADAYHAHNSMFDRNVVRKHLPGFDWDIRKWRDSMVQAYCHALPGALGVLGTALRVTEQEHKINGREYINLFCKPRPKNCKVRRETRLTQPAKWEEFKEYAIQDAEAARAARRAMPKWNYPSAVELANWHLDQVINDRGFQVDMDLVDAAIETVRVEQLRLKAHTADVTDGELTSTTQVDKTIQYIFEEYGVYLPDMQKATLERRLNDPDLPEPLKEILRIRLQTSATSTTKYKALKKATNNDGRCRGTIQFGGAKRTLRAAGRTFQPQNLPSRGLMGEDETEFGVWLMKKGVANEHPFVENPMHLCTSAVRRCLVASEGKKLVVSDLANIEGRAGAWVSGEEWKLCAFEEYDNGTGPDLYNLAYSKAFAVDINTVTSKQRAIGKVMELMLQYEGGVGAFVVGALGYGFDLDKLAADIWETLSPDLVREARDYREWRVKKKMGDYGLSERAFITCDVLKRLWRRSNPAISSYWKVLGSAVATAIANPGEIVPAGPLVRARRDREWLRVQLPSGRFLCYPSPRLDESGKINFMGDNPYTRKWERIKTYGGKLFENVVQAASRDVLYASMPRAEEAGYPIVLHVHDELVTEPLDTKDFSHAKLSGILASPKGWTTGLPLAAAGFESYYYRK